LGYIGIFEEAGTFGTGDCVPFSFSDFRFDPSDDAVLADFSGVEASCCEFIAVVCDWFSFGACRTISFSGSVIAFLELH